MPDHLRALLDATRRAPLSIDDLADRLDLAPRRVRDLVERARADGYAVRLENGHVGRLADDTARDAVISLGIPPTVGKPTRIAHLSDTHFGSVYCLRDAIKDFVRNEYERGVRLITHSGDFAEGDYSHARFEVSHAGADEQARDAFETLPRLPGLRYVAIAGNHDWTFSDRSGLDAGKHFERWFREHGRDDLRFVGNRSAHVEIAGARLHLWHPSSGGAYATSYPLQKKAEGYASGEKPHVLIAGHWHAFGHIVARGVHCIAAPTMQGRAAQSGGRSSQFGNSLTRAPAIGGLELEWTLTEHRTMRDFRLSYRQYFQRERAHVLEADDGEIFAGAFGGES